MQILLNSDDIERTIRDAITIIFSLVQQDEACQVPSADLIRECC
jgi:hypothetical protein